MGRCAAFQCKEIGVYKFPRDPVMRRKWDIALKRLNFKSTEFSRLCRLHFLDTDFEPTVKTTGFPHRRKFLKKSAVPSIFSWSSALKTESSDTVSRAERLRQRNAKRCLIPSTSTSESAGDESVLATDLSNPDCLQEVEIMDTSEEASTSTLCSSGQNKTSQTPFSFRLFSTNEFVTDNETVHFYTGLETYEKFKLVLSTLCPMANDLKYKVSQVVNLSIEDQFLILLIKLRRNKSDFELPKFFAVSKTVVSNIFVTWLNFTYDMWSLLDIWPERDLIDYYMPVEFKKHYPTTRVILDGTEIPISKPQNPTAQQATFSTYKNKNTMKFMVGATPGLLFSYCSEGYGGSTSDRQMIERSDLLQKCSSGDSVMADRGINVQDIFASKNIDINIPAFLKGKSQLSGVTVKRDRTIARQRVHIERLIGLSKTFTILKSDLNPYYVPLASRIFFVCVMLCNFRECIGKKSK